MILPVLFASISLAYGANTLHGFFQSADAGFRLLDTNGNGFYDPKEMAAEFRALDTNHDNHLSRDEFVRAYGGANSLANGMFDLLDTNGDGVLDGDGTTVLHMSLDGNHDGRVSRGEFDKFYAKIMMYAQSHQGHQGEHHHHHNE